MFALLHNFDPKLAPAHSKLCSLVSGMDCVSENTTPQQESAIIAKTGSFMDHEFDSDKVRPAASARTAWDGRFLAACMLWPRANCALMPAPVACVCRASRRRCAPLPSSAAGAWTTARSKREPGLVDCLHALHSGTARCDLWTRARGGGRGRAQNAVCARAASVGSCRPQTVPEARGLHVGSNVIHRSSASSSAQKLRRRAKRGRGRRGDRAIARARCTGQIRGVQCPVSRGGRPPVLECSLSQKRWSLGLDCLLCLRLGLRVRAPTRPRLCPPVHIRVHR